MTEHTRRMPADEQVPPETIWLIDQGPDGYVWCDEPNPAGEADPPHAVEYVRADALARIESEERQ